MSRNTAEKLQQLLTEQLYTVSLLDKSLAIKHLWRTAFDYGDVKSRWMSNSVNGSRDTSRDPNAHVGEMFIISNAMGDVKKFSYDDVPRCLGGGKEHPTVAAAADT